MKTMPVIQRMITKRLSISRPKVEITWTVIARLSGSHQSGEKGA